MTDKKYVIAYDKEDNKYWRGRIPKEYPNILYISVATWFNIPDMESDPSKIVNFEDFDEIIIDSRHNE